MRAFDAAVYLTGKEPYYFVYPKSHFPTRPKKPSREFVQMEAKKYADKVHEFPVNPTSYLVNSSKPGSVEVPPELTGKERSTLVPPDVKVVQKMDVARLDEFLQNADYRLPALAELIPALEENSLWSLDLTAEEAESVFWGAKADVQASKAGVEEPKSGVKESEAFDKGYNNPDSDVLGELLDRDPPETFLPYIEGESVFYSQARLPSPKRKLDTIEGFFVAKDHVNVGLSESDAIDVAGDWWKNLFDVVATDEPPLLVEDFESRNDPMSPCQ